MVENTQVKNALIQFIEEGKIAGARIIIHKKDELVCDAQYGYADIANKIPVKEDSIFRLASMTKPIMAIAIMQLSDQKMLSIDDSIEKYLPQFKDMKVADHFEDYPEFYEPDPENPFMPKVKEGMLEKIGSVPALNPITIRDILNHSSGMGQGPVSQSLLQKTLKPEQTLKERLDIIANTLLDFQPGTRTGYSAGIAYELLGAIIEVVTGMDLDSYLREKLCKPMGIQDLGFIMSEEQSNRIVKLYEANNGELRDVTETDEPWKMINPMPNRYFSGSGGLSGSITDYDKIVRMLYSGGKFKGTCILEETTVQMMSSESSEHHLDVIPGSVWGLGIVVVHDRERLGQMSRGVGNGTFGWSGAYGTHFYIDPLNELTMTLGVNCSNIGGAGSMVSFELERVIDQEFNQK